MIDTSDTNESLIKGNFAQDYITINGDFNTTGINKLHDLEGTYTGGSAYVCVYDNGTLFASEVACP